MPIGFPDVSDRVGGVGGTLWNAARVEQIYDSLDQRGLNVKDPQFGAVGDGVTDDTAAIQAAIDACTTGGGGTVVCPPSTYRCLNVVLKEGVLLVGNPGVFGYLAGGAPVNQTKFVGAGSGVVIDTPSGNTANCGVIGINVQGLGAGTALKGIRFRNVDYGVVRQVHLNNFADEGLLVESGSLGCFFEDIFAINCVLDRTQAAVIGAVDIHGTDHWFNRAEVSISGATEGTVQSVNLYHAAIVWRATNCDVDNIIGEISDIGVYVSGGKNRFSSGRADLNYGHGFYVTGGSNQFIGCSGQNNSQDTTNTYDNWYVSGVNNQLNACNAISDITKVARYGFNDQSPSGDANKNYYGQPLAYGSGTADYFGASGSAAAWAFPRGAARTLTANSATPSVSGYEFYLTANTVDTLISNFLGGVNGMVLEVVCNDTHSTIQHDGTNIVVPSAGNVKLRNGSTYRFFKNGAWRFIGETSPYAPNVSADNGDAAKSLQFLVHEPTQRWATPLTADRAVTLSTTGAYAGAKFRIVRTAAATGAFNLNLGVGPLKALAAGTWADVEYNGAAWMLTAYGAL